MTKIVCASDIHGQQGKRLTAWFDWNPADILIYAGDLQLNGFDDGSKFLAWMDELPYTHKVVCLGNHDTNSDLIVANSLKYENITVAINDVVIVNNLKIFVSPYTPRFLNWAFMLPDSELSRIWNTIPNDVDILVTHTPVYGIHDETDKGNLIGSMSLKERIPALKNLTLHVCGHNHGGYGVKKIGKVTYINATILNDKYKLANDPVIYEYSRLSDIKRALKFAFYKAVRREDKFEKITFPL